MVKNYFDEKDIQINFKGKLYITKKPLDAKNLKNLKSELKDTKINFENLITLNQIHSNKIIKIENLNNKEFEADALITNIKGIPLMVYGADCVIMSIIDCKKNIIAAVHSGWRGTYEKICKKVIEIFLNDFKSDIKDIKVFIGPSAGPCCYEVKEDLIDKFESIFKNDINDFYKIKKEKIFLDLWKINEHLLIESGVLKENIVNNKICTMCNVKDYHSFRKENTKKRIGLIVQLD